MKYFIILAIIVSYVAATIHDRTLEYNEIGEAIVDVVIDKIESSCLFVNDKLMLKRLAYVQSGYGARNNATEYIGGIWRVSVEQFKEVKRTIDMQKLENVFRRYNVDLNSAIYEELNIPFYSGLFSILYLERLIDSYKIDGVPLRANEQAVIFKEHIKPNANFEAIDVYKQKSDEMEPKCVQKKPIDIFILLDESGSIGTTNFGMIKNFLVNFSRNFDLGNDNTRSRISLALFANRAKISYSFTDKQSNDHFENHVLKIPFGRGKTNTAEGMDLMMAQVAQHRRPASSSIPMVIVVITDGASNDKAKTLAAARKAHDQNLLVFALGIGNPKNLDTEELNSIASAPSCTHTFLLNSFDDLEYFTKILIKEFSEASHILSGSYGAVNLKSEVFGSFNFQTIISAAGTEIEVKEDRCGTSVALYLSYTITKPSEVLYDTKVVINCTSPYKTKVFPVSSTKDRIYGSIRVIRNDRAKRAAKIAPFEDDESGDLEIKYTPECLPPGLSSAKLPFTITIRGNGPCPHGLYGDACDKECKCRGGVSCEKLTGECPNGACDYGFYGPGCQLKCPANTYSYLCSKKCRCRNGAQCDAVTGACPNNECEVGWRGSDCQNFACYNKVGQFHADQDFCDRFWYCATNEVHVDGQLVTCPNGLYWNEGTAYCKHPSKLAKVCYKGSSRWFIYGSSVRAEELSEFARAQYNIYLIYKNTKLDRDAASANSAWSSFYLRKIERIWYFDEAYACPQSLHNLTASDINDRFRQLTVRAQFTRENCSRGESDMACLDSFNYGIYRHDPNSCSFYHKCEYDRQKLIQSKLLMCVNAVFNQKKLKCVTARHYRFDQLRSTMPDEEQRKVCDEYLATLRV